MKLLYRPFALCFALFATTFLICAMVGHYFFSENVLDWFFCCIISIILSFIFFKCAQQQLSQPIFKCGILLTTGVLWLLAAVLGALPYCLILKCSFLTGVFESISGLTTTGASVLQAPESLPHSLLLWRAFSQWLGGLGFIFFFISFLGNSDTTHKGLLIQETTFSDDALVLFNLRKRTFNVLIFYVFSTLVCGFLLRHFGLSNFDAICHALSTVSTGGFSTHNNGITDFNIYSKIVLMCFMFLGGLNVLFFIQVFSKRNFNSHYNQEFRTYLIIILTALLAIITQFSFLKQFNAQTLFEACFQVISFSTTTGFNANSSTLWPPASITVLLLLSFIGGCSGSTAGGLKVFRITAIIQIIGSRLEKTFHTSVVRTLKIGRTIWDKDKQIDVLQFFTLTLFIIFTGVLLLQWAMPRLDFSTALSISVANLSNVGLGAISSPAMHQNVGVIPDAALFVMSLLMLLGRLELYAILVLFSKKFWKHFE